MALKINKPGDELNQKPKLSKLGKIVLAALAVLLIIVVIAVLSMSAAGRKKAEKESDLAAAVDRSVRVCESALNTVGADSKTLAAFDEYAKQIEKEKKADKKADAALSMIDFALKQAEGNQSVTDELNGARNRIFVALKAYNNP